jgi:hypothetical protein
MPLRVALIALASLAVAGCGSDHKASSSATDSGRKAHPKPCGSVGGDAEARLMQAYIASGTFPARQVNNPRGAADRITVTIPPITFTGAGRSPTLPVGPCQTIYRFGFQGIQAPHGAAGGPFRYAEVDWNTEGLPRGPNNSFSSAHFDFHFYLQPRELVDRSTQCPSSNGRTCDQQLTGFGQMRRFLDLPIAAYVPPGYFPDTGSSIPLMGFHTLDGRLRYSVDKVNHYPTLIYGTFQGRLLFAESSVTLYTLQDAVSAPSHTVTFPFRQPLRYQDNIPWPTRFTVRYDPRTRGLTAAFEGFGTHGPRTRP